MPEAKVNIIKVIRSILRENVRRNMGTLERGCKERLAPLRSTVPSSAKLGETAAFPSSVGVPFRVNQPPPVYPGSSRASWLYKQPPADLSAHAGYPKLGPDSDEGSLSSGTYSLSGAPPSSASPDLHILPVQENWSETPGSQARPPSAVKESDILSDEDDDGFSEGGARRGSGDSGGSSSPTSAIEAQFLQLRLSEAASRAPAPRVQPEDMGDTPETQPRLLRGHVGAVKRSQGGGSPPGAADLNALLEREFSVQSLTSVVNEDCFYEGGAPDSGRGAAS